MERLCTLMFKTKDTDVSEAEIENKTCDGLVYLHLSNGAGMIAITGSSHMLND